MSEKNMKVALITEDGEQITYKELGELTEKAVLKLEKRKLLFLMTQNNLESIVFYVGSLKKRVIPMLLHLGLDSEVLEKLLQQYQPLYVVLPGDYHWNGTEYQVIDTFRKYVVYKSMNETERNYSVYDELALLLSTSGSTGSTKCVRLSYENIEENTKSICQSLDIRESDRAITTLPMEYTYGLSIINTHTVNGR